MEQNVIDTALERVRTALEAGQVDEAISVLTTLHPADRADAFADLPPDDQNEILPRLDAEATADLLEELEDEEAAEVAAQLSAETLADALDEMEPDEAADVLGDLSPEQAASALAQMDASRADEVIPLLAHADDTAGGLMTSAFFALRRQMTAQMAIEFLRTQHPDTDTPYYLYVVDRFDRLIGIVGLRDLIVADPQTVIESIMRPEVTNVPVGTDQEEVARLMSRYDLAAMPVVDGEGKLVGVIHSTDIVNVVEEEATEDLQKIGGLEALDEPYMLISFWRMVRKRAGWLIILFLSEMLTATAMGFFEVEIARAVVLALFVPLIISSGGNSGSQAATLVIRAMALGEVKLRDWWRVMRREVLSGLTLGAILGSIGFLRIAAWNFAFDTYGPYWPLIGLTVGLSLIGIVLWGTLAGSMLPLFLRRIGLDPATSSAPFVATLVDVTGLIIYFSVASLVLRGTLL
ncbi:MAG TPA: magnesium transporter [Anaerolineales bacterium]|nr:magnesium transporter [Anaerolineales bacterium]